MMTHTPTRIRLAAALLLTAAAFPSTALLAQETTTTPVPVVDTAPPPPLPTETPAPVMTPAPAATAPTPAPATSTPATQPAPRATTRSTTTSRAAARPVGATRTPARAAPAPEAAPAPQAAAPAPAPVEPVPAPVAETPPPPVAVAPAPPAAPVQEQSNTSILPWAIAGLLALGALAFFLLRRRRAARVADEPVYETDRAEAYEPVAAAAAVPVETGRPELDLDLRPRRAGVTGSEAVVEFELSVDNHGSAAARDVRVSAWMVAGGQESEAERALIDRPDQASLPAIEAGSAERMSGAVTLPTSGVDSDAVLPVVVAEARYTLPDGSEGRTQASYAVGVPDGEELAYFAIDNPSGLHDDVVARELGEAERA